MDAKTLMTAEQQRQAVELAPLVRSHALRASRRNEEIKADIANAEAEAMLFLCRMLAKNRPLVGKLSTYCHAALTNFFRNWPVVRSVRAISVTFEQLDKAVEVRPQSTNGLAVDLAAHVNNLPGQEAFIIRSLFGIGVAQRGPTALARELGVSETWIFVLRKRALDRLRRKLGAYERTAA